MKSSIRSTNLRTEIRAILPAIMLGLALLGFQPASASAAVTCSFAGGALDVDVSAGSTTASVRLQSGGDDIEIFDGTPAGGVEVTPCGGVDQPETTTTSSIQFDDTVAGQNTQFVVDNLFGAPAPGAGAPEATGSSEIEVTINAGDGGNDRLSVQGTNGPDVYRFGALSATAVGVNLDDDDDSDDIVINNGEGIQNTNGLGGADTLDASGGAGFTGPAPYDSPGASAVNFSGGADGDTIIAGSGTSRLVGGEGTNTLVGGPAADSLDGSFGIDTMDGGAGIDFASYQFAPVGPLVVDLRIAGAQDTGVSGTDTLSGLENIVGSQNAGKDTLIGTSGPNQIFANAGDDTLIGLGGNDVLNGGAGTDTASYAEGSSGPITLSLGTTAAQATGGAGSDTLPDGGDADTEPDIENIVGSPFADTLTGNDLRNRIVGLGGGDTLSLLGEDDTFDVYDGGLDTVTCGTGHDGGVADEPGVDALDQDCEEVDHAPQTTIDTGPVDGGTIDDATPTYSLSSSEPSSFAYSVDGGAFQPCPASCELPALGDGAHTVAFRATDATQLTDLTPVSRVLVLDTTPAPAPPGSGQGAPVDPPAPADPQGPTTAPADTDAPETRISRTAVHGSALRVLISADEDGVSFECKLDSRPFRACASTKRYRHLAAGWHTIRVRAIDAAGNLDESPARKRARVG